MAKILYAATTITLLLLISSSIPKSHSQQEYVNNKQLDCDNEYNSTKGNLCNSVSSCDSYLTFKSSPPEYDTPSSISYLLNATPANIAAANNITDVQAVAADTLITIPVNCSCSGAYYQHNASYSIKVQGETYFSIANNTYQSLTTCQALKAQNPYNERNLTVGLNFHVPLRCACPTQKQREAGFKYLLTYLVSKGESVSAIADIFGVDEQSVLEANELSDASVIFYFTPISVPLKTEPPKKLLQAVTPPEDSPSPPPPPSGNGDSDSSTKWVIVGVVVGVVRLLLVGAALFFLCRGRHPLLQLLDLGREGVELPGDFAVMDVVALPRQARELPVL